MNNKAVNGRSSLSLPEDILSLFSRAQAHPLWQPVAYLVVGGWNTLFGVGLYALAYFLLKDRVNYFTLLICCNLIAITNAFVCYKLFVFKTKGNWPREYLRFCGVYGVAMLLGMGLVAALVQLLHLHPVLANIAVTGLTIIISFIGHKHVSFAPRSINN